MFALFLCVHMHELQWASMGRAEQDSETFDAFIKDRMRSALKHTY